MTPWLANLLLLLLCAALGLALRSFARMERSRRAWKRLSKDRIGMFCAGVLGVFLLIGLADCLQLNARQSLLDTLFARVPREESYSAPLAHQSLLDGKPLKGFHLLGTTLLGKDVLLETLKACRTALLLGGMTSLIYLPIGALFGILAGYYRKWVDDIIQYLYSTMASIPNILLLVAVMMILGRGLDKMALALSLTAWIGLCRLVRGETLRQAERPYVEAARALGQRHRRILFSHILPNVMHLVIINAILGFSGLVLAESILSYLGVGVPVGTASWGIMIDSARMELSRDPVVWWPLTAASGALFLLVLSLNLFGEALRRAFDPKAL